MANVKGVVSFANKNQLLEREMAAWLLWHEFHSGHESSAAGWKTNTILEANMRYYLENSKKLMPGGHDDEDTDEEEESDWLEEDWLP